MDEGELPALLVPLSLEGEKEEGRICAIHAKLCMSGRKLLCVGGAD